MKTSILLMFIITSLFLIPASYGLPQLNVTSYHGYVTVNGIPVSNAVITVYDATGSMLTSATSLDSPNLGLYQVTVPWADNETITFKVNGITAASTVIAAVGTSNPLDLAITTITTTTTPTATQISGGGGGAPPASTATQTQAVTQTATPVQTVAETPQQTSTPVPVSTPARRAPGFGFIAGIIVIMYLAIRIR